MRTSHVTIIVIVAAVFLLQISALHAQSPDDTILIVTDNQVVDCTTTGSFETDREPINTIFEEDYPFLRSIQCLKSSDFINSRGWNLTLKNIGTGQATHYVLRGKGSKIEIQATYDKDGNIDESLLRVKDTRIPPAVRQFIFSDEFDGWDMIGNEKVVKDFDPYQTEYNIILSDGNKEQVLNFKEFGNTIAFSGIISRDERPLESILSYK